MRNGSARPRMPKGLRSDATTAASPVAVNARDFLSQPSVTSASSAKMPTSTSPKKKKM